MILPIYIYGQPVLRKVAEDITPDYPELKELINNMYETLDSSNGIGLAAPQIGLAIRLVVIDLDVLRLQLQIFIIVETDLHDCFPPLVQNLKNITGCIIYQIGPAGKRFRPFWGRKIR